MYAGGAFEWVAWLMDALARNDAGYRLYNLGTAVAAIAIMLPAAFFAGATLPLFTSILLRAGLGESAIGKVYACNTFGAILGVFAAIHLLIPLLGLRDTMIIAAANGRCIGGGFWICPGAEPDDGRFDICIVNRLSFAGALRALPLIMRGKHEKHPKVEMHRARDVVIEAMGPDPLFFQLDGELHEPPDARTLTLGIRPGALPVLAGS
jgi:hypothetical protein